MKKIWIVLAAAIVAVLGFWTYENFWSAGAVVVTSPTPSTSLRASPSTSPSTTLRTSPASQEKIFTVVGRNYSYTPSVITVNQGDKVKIIFQDEDGFHDLSIGGLSLATLRLNRGQQSTLEFVASQKGTFEFSCSVDGHAALGMKGQLIVR